MNQNCLSLRGLLLLVLASLMYGAQAAWAEEAGAGMFAAGAYTLSLEADYLHSFDLRKMRNEGGQATACYYFFDNLSLGLEFGGMAVQQPFHDAVITNGGFWLRHNLYNRGRFSFYVDAGAAISYASTRVPADGLYMNFIIQTGPGVMYEISDSIWLNAGGRYWHLSNAQIDGPTRNPSTNAWEVYLGMIYLVR